MTFFFLSFGVVGRFAFQGGTYPSNLAQKAQSSSSARRKGQRAKARREGREVILILIYSGAARLTAMTNAVLGFYVYGYISSKNSKNNTENN